MFKRVTMVLLLLMAFALSVAGPGIAKNYPRPVDEQNTDHPWGGDDSSSPDDPINAGPVSPNDPTPKLVFNGGTKSGIIVSFSEYVWSGFQTLIFYVGPQPKTVSDRTGVTANVIGEPENSTPNSNGGKDGQ